VRSCLAATSWEMIRRRVAMPVGEEETTWEEGPELQQVIGHGVATEQRGL